MKRRDFFRFLGFGAAAAVLPSPKLVAEAASAHWHPMKQALVVDPSEYRLGFEVSQALIEDSAYTSQLLGSTGFGLIPLRSEGGPFAYDD